LHRSNQGSTVTARERRIPAGYALISNGPWYLGQVSSRWRTVALSTSPLWSTIIVSVPLSGTPSLIRYRYEEGLRRAQNALMSLTFGGPFAELQHLASMATSRCRRWKFFSWDDTLHHGYFTFLSTLSGNLPNLKVLDLTLNSLSGCEDLAMFSQAPELCHLRLTGWFSSRSPGELLLPWKQLTCVGLDLKMSPLDRIMWVLMNCPRLRIFRDLSSNDLRESAAATIRGSRDLCHTYLVTLETTSTPYLRYISLPSLRVHHIPIKGSFTGEIQPFLSLWERSKANLEDLSFSLNVRGRLSHEWAHAQAFMSSWGTICRLNGGLRTLRLNIDGDKGGLARLDDVFRVFTWTSPSASASHLEEDAPPDNGYLLPRLESIEIQLASLPRFILDLEHLLNRRIKQMIASRRGVSTSPEPVFRQFALEYAGPQPRSAIPIVDTIKPAREFGLWMEEGMEISIFSKLEAEA
jgi:hypothetical protein